MYYNCSKNSLSDWGYPFYVFGVSVFVVGLINLFFLVAYPQKVGLTVLENGDVLDPSKQTKHPDRSELAT